MLELLAAGENLAFGLVEAVGLGSGALGHDIDGHGEWLGWLGFGRLSLLRLLVVFLACFGVIGLVGQQLALSHLGALLPGWISAR